MAACLLTHFDPDKEFVLACDDSLYGISIVLSYKTLKGEKSIAFASCSLSAAEKKYSQLDEEGLLIVFSVKKFHNYSLGSLKSEQITSHWSIYSQRIDLFLS